MIICPYCNLIPEYLSNCLRLQFQKDISYHIYHANKIRSESILWKTLDDSHMTDEKMDKVYKKWAKKKRRMGRKAYMGKTDHTENRRDKIMAYQVDSKEIYDKEEKPKGKQKQCYMIKYIKPKFQQLKCKG